MCGSKASLLRAADTFRVKWSEQVHLVGYVAELHWPRRPGKTLYREARSVALQLCPPLQFGPLTYQPIEWGFVSSNQSALWSCLLHVTSQLGEGCSMSFVRFSVLIVWKTCVWNSFGAFSPMGFWRILQKFEVCSKLSSVNAYVHMLES